MEQHPLISTAYSGSNLEPSVAITGPYPGVNYSLYLDYFVAGEGSPSSPFVTVVLYCILHL